MLVNSIETVNLRGLKDGIYKFKSGTNLILGRNGTGKTSILEAIFLTNYGDSFRTSKKLNLIKTDQNFCKIATTLEIFNSNLTVGVVIKNVTQFTLNNKTISSVLNTKTSKDSFKTLIFTPDSIASISGAPALRREMFDRYIGSLNSNYIKTLSEYNKVLRQRNALLKSEKYQGHGDKEATLQIWNLKLVEYGNKIISHRSDFIQSINPIAREFYNKISNKADNLEIMYLPNVAELSHQHLDQNIDKEIQLQNTLFGPHKDDFDVIIKSKLSKNQLSRGEQRTVGLSILFSVHSLIKEKLDLSPVLLLDDIASELDVIRVDFLMKYIPESQVIITTTEKINSDHISNIINL